MGQIWTQENIKYVDTQLFVSEREAAVKVLHWGDQTNTVPALNTAEYTSQDAATKPPFYTNCIFFALVVKV